MEGGTLLRAECPSLRVSGFRVNKMVNRLRENRDQVEYSRARKLRSEGDYRFCSAWGLLRVAL